MHCHEAMRAVPRPHRRLPRSWALLILLGASPTLTHADERYFTYSYEPKVLPRGALEFEQWATARIGKEDGVYNRWDLRSEFEYGITDNLTSALYLNLRSLHIDRDEEEEDSFEFKGLSSEWKYKISDPTADPIGFLLYGEVTTDFKELEFEEKLVLGKNVGRFVLAVNAIAEQEWEFENDETEKEFKLEFTAGVAYRITDRFGIGLELREVNVFPDYERLEHAALFAGPAIHYHTEGWWLAFTVLPQVLSLRPSSERVNLDEFERVEVRLILGIHF